MVGGAVGHKFEMGLPKDYPSQIWFNLVQWLLTDFVCLYTYEFWLSLWKIVRSSVILLLPLFREEDLNVIFYQHMPNLHNRYKLAERISHINPEYMLNYSFPCSCSKNLSSFRFIIKQQWTIEEISIFSNSSHLERRAGLSDPPKDHPCQVWFNLVQGFQRRRFKCESLRRTTTDAKWWQKLTWPLAGWAKKLKF
jgi:hypothetical protein